MDLGFDVVVTITGIVLVFLILILLPRKPPRLPLYSPLHPCSRPQLLLLLRWKRAFPVM